MTNQPNFEQLSNPPQEDESTTVVVVLYLDHHIGSTPLTNFYRTISLFDSQLITHSHYNQLLFKCKLATTAPAKLLYRGTRDGFKAHDFHSKCDNQGPTLTIVKSFANGHHEIFGGFTTASWKSPSYSEFISDRKAFIFKMIENSRDESFRIFNIRQNAREYAKFANKEYLPIFGGGNDIRIYSDCNLNYNSYSDFGHTYELPTTTTTTNDNDDDPEYYYHSEKARNYLARCFKFKVCEIEIFKITLQ